jgi:bifunctional non-homologous end joining protein LigD
VSNYDGPPAQARSRRTGRQAGASLDLAPLAKLVDEAPSGERWAHEIKYDGYRLHARIAHGHRKWSSRSRI